MLDLINIMVYYLYHTHRERKIGLYQLTPLFARQIEPLYHLTFMHAPRTQLHVHVDPENGKFALFSMPLAHFPIGLVLSSVWCNVSNAVTFGPLLYTMYIETYIFGMELS